MKFRSTFGIRQVQENDTVQYQISSSFHPANHAPPGPSDVISAQGLLRWIPLPMLTTARRFFSRPCAVSPSPNKTISTCRRSPVKVMPAAHSDEEASAKAAAPLHNHHNIKDEVEPTQSLPEQCARVHKRVYELLERENVSERVRQVQQQTRISLGVIGQALDKYSLEELSFSYNGGKDCLVLLILYLAALHTHATGRHQPNNNHTHKQPIHLPPTLRSVYIVTPNPFPSVTTFVSDSARKYHLSLAQYHKPMREAFASYLADYPQVKAIFVGTRRTDPHGANLTSFDPTDGGWPSFMRIHPVIDWQYVDIWGFIREVGVEYCELYDMGYTSLGGTDDTHPNPALEVRVGAEEEVKYRPAYELVEDEEERLGRDR